MQNTIPSGGFEGLGTLRDFDLACRATVVLYLLIFLIKMIFVITPLASKFNPIVLFF
jgi:hypothetical protein